MVQVAVGEILAALPATAADAPGASPMRMSAVAGMPMPRPRRGASKLDVSAAVGAAVAAAVRAATQNDEKMIVELVAQVKRLRRRLPLGLYLSHSPTPPPSTLSR